MCTHSNFYIVEIHIVHIMYVQMFCDIHIYIYRMYEKYQSKQYKVPFLISTQRELQRGI